MAVINKDFKVKNGLIVEGASGTINNQTILTEVDGDAYIIDLVGGESFITSTSNEFDVSAEKELSIDRTTVDAYYDAAGSADAAETAANGYTDGEITTALTTAQGYADDAEADAISAANSYADGLAVNYDVAGAAAAAQQAAEDYADGLAVNYDVAGAAAAAQQAAEDYADGLAVNYDPAGSAAAAQTAAEGFATQAIANLVDSAPETLDTLNELAAALQDNPDIISDLQDIAAGKQDELTPGANIDITGATISVTGLSTDDVAEDAGNLYFTNQRALDATAAAYDVVGSGAGALEQANDYTDGEITTALTTAQGYADDAEAAAIAHADALTTDDVEEGSTNQYYTTTRAKIDAAALLTGATLENITITGDEDGLTITAENGVADSDTDDLTEGSSNLYFTDQRAVDALEAVTPNFVEIDINSIATQIAATVNVPTASTVTAHAFPKADYRSAEYLVKVAYGTHTEISKVLLTLDTSDNIAITEYAIVGTNGSASTISADVSGTDVRLRVATANNGSDVTVVGTLVA
jgi:hypothetical protein